MTIPLPAKSRQLKPLLVVKTLPPLIAGAYPANQPPIYQPALIEPPPLAMEESAETSAALTSLVWGGCAVLGSVAAALLVAIVMIWSSAAPVQPSVELTKTASPETKPVQGTTSGPVSAPPETSDEHELPKPEPKSHPPGAADASDSTKEKLRNPLTSKPAESFEETVARVKESVVRIETDGGLGSGVVIDESGIVATNFHVMSGARRAVALFADGRKLPVAGYVYYSQECDLCLIQLRLGTTPVVALPVASELPKQGAAVFTVGNPEGLQFTVTKGIVSAVTTTKELNKLSGRNSLVLAKPGNATWIQTDASIDNGNSGGPLLTEQGVILGLNTFMIPSINNAYFANTGPAIQTALQNLAALTSLPSLPGEDRGPETDHLLPSPEDMQRATRGIIRGDFLPAIEVLIKHRNLALNDEKIVSAPQARELQTNLVDVETGVVGLVEISRKLGNRAGPDFLRYLHVIQQIDEAIELRAPIEQSVNALAALIARPPSDEAGITAACILHRIHVRDSSRTKIPELLIYLSTQDSLASQRMLDWYLHFASQPASRNRKKFLDDLQRERDVLQRLVHPRRKTSEIEMIARRNAREYNQILTAHLFEDGFDGWKFRCVPTKDGLQLSLGAGFGSIVLPNDYGITEPCDVALRGRLTTADGPVLTVDGVKHRFTIAAERLQDVQLHKIIKESPNGDKYLAVPLAR